MSSTWSVSPKKKTHFIERQVLNARSLLTLMVATQSHQYDMLLAVSDR